MATDEFLSPDQLAQIDAHGSLADLGRIELDHPTACLGEDGRLDTEVETSGNEFITASDFEHDGYADDLKILDSDGDYSTWEYRHEADGTSQWVESEHGHLDDGAIT